MRRRVGATETPENSETGLSRFFFSLKNHSTVRIFLPRPDDFLHNVAFENFFDRSEVNDGFESCLTNEQMVTDASPTWLLSLGRPLRH